MIYNFLISTPVEYELIIDDVKRMLVCYILEVAKMDQEIASVLKRKPTVVPIGSSSDINKMKMGKIDPKLNSVMFTSDDGQKCLFALIDKHLFTTI